MINKLLRTGMLVITTVTVLHCNYAWAIDDDADGVDNHLDNCLFVTNANQTDNDGDGWGDVCDPDFDNNQVVNYLDYLMLADSFGQTNSVFDITGDGVVNFIDFFVFRGYFLQAPGPAGYANWNSEADGDWSDSANWFPGVVPHADADVSINSPDAGTSITVTFANFALESTVHSLTIGETATLFLDVPNNVTLNVDTDVVISGVLRLDNGLLRVENEMTLLGDAADLQFLGGRIADARITASSGELLIDPFETFWSENITLAANLTIADRGSFIVSGDLELEQVSIRIEDRGSSNNSILFLGSQRLFGEGEIIYDSEPPNFSTVAGNVTVGAGSTLTVESGITVRTGDSAGIFGNDAAGLVMRGALVVDQPNHILQLKGDLLSIEGPVTVTDGGRLSIFGNWVTTAEGSISVSSVGDLDLNGDWVNYGSITSTDGIVSIDGGQWTNLNVLDLQNSTLELGGQLDSGAFDQFTTNGPVSLIGELANTDSSLNIDNLPGSSFELGHTGAIIGGEIVGESALAVSSGTPASNRFATLDGVRLSTDLYVNGSRLVLVNGLELNDSTIYMQAVSQELDNAEIQFQGSQELGGQGSVVFNCLPDSFDDDCVVSVSQFIDSNIVIGEGVVFETGTSGAVFDTFCSFPSACSYQFDGDVIIDIPGEVELGGGTESSTLSGQVLVSGGGTFLLSGEWISDNDSQIQADQSTVRIESNWTNYGTVTANDSASFIGVSLVPWHNLGTISLVQTPLTLGGSFVQSDFINMMTDSLVTIRGILNNEGQVLNLDTVVSSGLAFDGLNARIVGGTVERELDELFEVSQVILDGVLLRTGLVVTNRLTANQRLTLDNVDILLESRGGVPRMSLEDGTVVDGTGEIRLKRQMTGLPSAQIDIFGEIDDPVVFGPQITINVMDQSTQIGNFGSHYIIQGQILFMDVSFGTLRINGGFILEGLIHSANSFLLDLDGDFIIAQGAEVRVEQFSDLLMRGGWVNEGLISANNSDVEFKPGFLDNQWSNQGAISLTNADLILFGDFLASDLQGVNSDSNIILNGTLENQSGILNTDTLGTGILTLNNFTTITGGAIIGNNPVRVEGQNAVLDGVSLGADITVEQGATLNVVNDLYLFSASIKLNNAGGGAVTYLKFDGSQTVYGFGSIDFIGVPDIFLQLQNNLWVTGQDQVLTIEEGVAIRAVNNNGRIISTNNQLHMKGDIINLAENGRITWVGTDALFEGDLVVGRSARTEIDVVNFAFTDTALVDIVLDSDSNGVLEFNDPIDFNGSLALTLFVGFVPESCQSFLFGTYPSFGSEFDSFDSPVLEGDQVFTLEYGPANLQAIAPGVDCGL